MALAVLAVYGSAKRIAGAPAAAIAAALAACVPWMAMLGSVAYVEGLLLLYCTLAIGWILPRLRESSSRATVVSIVSSIPSAQHGQDGRGTLTPGIARLTSHSTKESPATADFILAGVMAGLACGVKYTAVPTVLAAIVAALLVARVRSGITLSTTARQLAVFIASATVVLSPWLIRNYAWTRNPVFPMALRTLGPGHFDPTQVERWERFHRVPDADRPLSRRLTVAAQRVLADWQFGYALIPVALVALLLGLRQREIRFLAVLLALQTVFWLMCTHVMPRFLVTAIPIGAMAIAFAFRERLAWIGGCIAIIVFTTGFLALQRDFTPRAAMGRQGLFGITDYSLMQPPELDGMASGKLPIALIADMPFSHPAPSRCLRYRTVFDIRFPAGKSVIDAWLGEDLASLQKHGAVIIHVGELRRLAKTVWAVPPLPPEWDRVPDEPIVFPKRSS